MAGKLAIGAMAHSPQAKGRVVVRKWLDGSVHFYWKGKPLLVEEIPVKTPKEEEPASIPA